MFENNKDVNGQSAAKPLSNEERSTTIPEGSTEINLGKQPVYHLDIKI